LLELIEQIKQTPATENGKADLQNATATELIGYILDKHHVFTKEEMARLEPLADKVVSAHGGNHSELLALRDLMRQLFEDLRPHMFKEEQILFPFIIALDKARHENRSAPFPPFGTVHNPIRMMLMEHDTAGELLREMRKLGSDYTVPADACISFKTFYKALEAFEQDLHEHIHLENNLLFPKAVALEGAAIRS
jgi:regulator of cell morphogenesis and NO signaling